MLSELNLAVVRDDGAVVYLNGVEIFRSNMPTGAIHNGTPAVDGVTGDEETNFHSKVISSALLLGGTNVVAAEVHQNGTNSSDLSFDLELFALPPESSPRLEIARSAGSVFLSWPAWAAEFAAFTAPSLAPWVAWGPLTNAPAVASGQAFVILPLTTSPQFFRLLRL